MKKLYFSLLYLPLLIVAMLVFTAKVIAAEFVNATFRLMHRMGMILSLNEFSKEEIVAFEDLLEGFEDGLVMSELFAVFSTDQVSMERSNNTIWRPQPYISQSFDGSDQTANFSKYTQLSVPATINIQKSVPWIMSATELRDALQENRLGKSAAQKLASDINVSCSNLAALTGTLVVPRSVAASGFDDVAAIEAMMNEQGIQMNDRNVAYSTRDYNGMASNLAGRQTLQGKPLTAYERAFIGRVASFDAYKLDYGYRLPAAAGGGGITMSTLVGALNYYVPRATVVDATTGASSNVDNRFQTITVSSTVNVAAGDAFTVATLQAVHHITKQSTGQLKTFRVMSVPSLTTLVISPPMITAQGGTDAELQYQNCTIVTPAANSALVWLNTVTNYANPFWQKDAMEILPGRLAVPSDAGAAVIRSSTKQGVELVMTKFFDIDTQKTKFRVDTYYGVVNKQPEMSGMQQFSQT